MKRFTKNIVERIESNPYIRVTKNASGMTTLRWGQSMSQIGSGFVYFLSWETKGGKISWREMDQDYNLVTGTGMTCIQDDINLDGDGLFVTIETLEAEKAKILAIADKIYAEQSAGN